jgi:hypothetical protein
MTLVTRLLLGLAALLICSAPAFAQVAPTAAQGRHGFTVLANLGVGFQHDPYLADSASGLAGPNVGAGVFVTNRIAILGRFSGTNADFGYARQVAGVLGGTVQFWVTDRFIVEGGGGFGYWSFNHAEFREEGYGLIVGANFVAWSRGSHCLLAGFEYAPTFTETDTVHSIGITFGYQLRKRR